jgi:hypothetical protein
VVGNPAEKMFGVFTALSVMAGVYGVAIIPEIQVIFPFHHQLSADLGSRFVFGIIKLVIYMYTQLF